MSISSYTTVTMLDSRPAPITISVPKSTDITNRIITFKDLYGSASNSTIILVTRSGDTFEDGTFSTIMSNAYQTVNLYAGQPGKWLNVGATGGGGDSAGLTTVSNRLNGVSTSLITVSTNLNTVSNHLNALSTNLITVSTSLNTVSNTVAAGRFPAISTTTISTGTLNAGYVVTRLPTNTAVAASVSPLAVVNGNAYLSFSPQIEFQYNSGGYKHFMGSRHQGDTPNSFGNAVDFWLYSATSGSSNASTTPGTCNVNTLSVTAGGVGIFNNSPLLALDVVGGGRITTLSTTSISTGTILADNISSYSVAAFDGIFSNLNSEFVGAIGGYISTLFVDSISTNTISTNTILTNTISTNTLTVDGTLYGRLAISTNNTTLTDPASIIIKTPNRSYFYEDYTNLTNYMTISNYGAVNGDYVNIVNTGNSGAPATFQVLDGSVGASTIIRYIYPGHAGVVAYSGSQWWPL